MSKSDDHTGICRGVAHDQGAGMFVPRASLHVTNTPIIIAHKTEIELVCLNPLEHPFQSCAVDLLWCSFSRPRTTAAFPGLVNRSVCIFVPPELLEAPGAASESAEWLLSRASSSWPATGSKGVCSCRKLLR